MIFFDASAFAKRYFPEVGSDLVSDLLQSPDFFCSLVLLHCELTSVLNRKLREGALTTGIFRSLKTRIELDLESFRTVAVSSNLISLSRKLLDAHPLKTLDVLYLAGALHLQTTAKEQVLFVSADRQLLRAARDEGLRVLDPEKAGPLA